MSAPATPVYLYERLAAVILQYLTPMGGTLYAGGAGEAPTYPHIVYRQYEAENSWQTHDQPYFLLTNTVWQFSIRARSMGEARAICSMLKLRLLRFRDDHVKACLFENEYEAYDDQQRLYDVTLLVRVLSYAEDALR